MAAGRMRSLMFVPGQRQKMLDKALGLALDVALFDLEDGVPPAEKATAREQVAAQLGRDAGGPARYVRMNALDTPWAEDDVRAIVRPGLEGILLPKADRPSDVVTLSRRLDELEPKAGVAAGTVRIIAAIESARALLDAAAIAAAGPRVAGLMFGGEDYAKDLGLPIVREGEAGELIYARSAIVNACAAAHVGSFDGVWPDIKDADGLRRDTLQARRLGFTGKSLIHPGQIDTINELFSPTPEDVDHARKVVAAFEDAQSRGEGAIAFGGQLIDLPIIERARRTIRVHEERAGPAQHPPVSAR